MSLGILATKERYCLNPCCGGIWSLSEWIEITDKLIVTVLILVVVGYGL